MFSKFWGYELAGIPFLRNAVAQFRADFARGKQSSITQELFNYALSVRGAKAPELRKGVEGILGLIGLIRVEKHGGGIYIYHCKLEGNDFQVWVNYGGRSAQLCYTVSLPEFKDVHPLCQFRFESALGFGHGNWDFITEENFDDSMQILREAVRYSVALPDRIRSYVSK